MLGPEAAAAGKCRKGAAANPKVPPARVFTASRRVTIVASVSGSWKPNLRYGCARLQAAAGLRALRIDFLDYRPWCDLLSATCAPAGDAQASSPRPRHREI